MENGNSESKLRHFTGDKDLEKYNQELEKDLNITKRNITEKSQSVSSLRCKWLNYYFFEKNENLRKLMNLKEKYSKEKIAKKNISDPLIRMKAEVALDSEDVKLKTINEMIKNTKERMDFLERAMDILSNLSLTIKNTVDLYKLESMS